MPQTLQISKFEPQICERKRCSISEFRWKAFGFRRWPSDNVKFAGKIRYPIRLRYFPEPDREEAKSGDQEETE